MLQTGTGGIKCTSLSHMLQTGTGGIKWTSLSHMLQTGTRGIKKVDKLYHTCNKPEHAV